MTEMPTAYVPLQGDQPYETTLHLSDGTYVKSYKVARAHTGLPQHSHDYSHTMYVATGSLHAWQDGVDRGVVVAPDGILIPAHTKHFFETLEDNTTVLCIHSLLEGDEPEIEDHHVVKMRDSSSGPAQSLEGFTFQEEGFEAWLADAQPLFRQHMTVTGQDPDGAMLKNIPLGRQLANSGAMLVTTARQNGRMFGYLLAMMTPTLDEAGVLTAHLMLPYASPDVPGIGKKLQSATIEILRAKGVTQVFARAGIRGDGPRLHSLYKRLGFKDDGTLHRLDL